MHDHGKGDSVQNILDDLTIIRDCWDVFANSDVTINQEIVAWFAKRLDEDCRRLDILNVCTHLDRHAKHPTKYECA